MMHVKIKMLRTLFYFDHIWNQMLFIILKRNFTKFT